MKRLFRKNHIIFAMLALLLVAAGYLNFTGKEMDKAVHTTDAEVEEPGLYQVEDDGQVTTSSKENPGEAVMVSSTIDREYFASAKLKREQTRARSQEDLMAIVNNEKLSRDEKSRAVAEVTKMTKQSQAENDAETLLKAKGFSQVVVSVQENSVDVVVSGEKLTQSKLAQIQDIVHRKTGVSADKIVITPVAVESK